MGNLKINAQELKKQTFGVEVEMGKISKKDACRIVNNYFNETYGTDNEFWYDGAHHCDYACYGRNDINGRARIWRFMDDGSSGGDWGSITCEMVTPILRYDDMEDLQQIIRLLRQGGARSGAHWNSGVHIHVGANFDEDGGQNVRSIRNLVNTIASHERLICDAVSVTPSRIQQWCRFVEPSFLQKINAKSGSRFKVKTKTDLEVAWYGFSGSHSHYDSTRYHLLNLHAIWDKGTIEFRCFEFHNNLHAGELKAWVQLCLAMCSYAKMVGYASPKPKTITNQKYSAKNWFNNMGLMGDEFKTMRKMLTKHLRGDTAYKGGRPSNDIDLDDLILDNLDTQNVVRG